MIGYKASPFRVMLPSRWERIQFALVWWALMISLVAVTAFAIWEWL